MRVLCWLSVVLVGSSAAAVMGQEDQPAAKLPAVGETVALEIQVGQETEAEEFRAIEIDQALLDELGVVPYPGAVGLIPEALADADDKPPSQGMLAADPPTKVASFFKRNVPDLEDMTQDVLAALLTTTARPEGGDAAAAGNEEIKEFDGSFLIQPDGVCICVLPTTTDGWTVIMAGPGELIAPGLAAAAGQPEEGEGMEPEPVGDPTYGKIPYDEGDPFIKIETTQGMVYVELYPGLAPLTAGNFQKLVEENYYDGLTFHRIISGFMIQGGDNRQGGPGWTIDLEISDIKHARGTLSMARTADPNSASAQFFLIHSYANSKHLDGEYAAFGRVVHGIEIVDAIVEAAGGGPGEQVLPSPDEAEKILSTELVDWATVKAAIEADAADDA